MTMEMFHMLVQPVHEFLLVLPFLVILPQPTSELIGVFPQVVENVEDVPLQLCGHFLLFYPRLEVTPSAHLRADTVLDRIQVVTTQFQSTFGRWMRNNSASKR